MFKVNIIKCPKCGQSSVRRCLNEWENYNYGEYFQQNETNGRWYIPNDLGGDVTYMSDRELEDAIFYECWECDYRWPTDPRDILSDLIRLILAKQDFADKNNFSFNEHTKLSDEALMFYSQYKDEWHGFKIIADNFEHADKTIGWLLDTLKNDNDLADYDVIRCFEIWASNKSVANHDEEIENDPNIIYPQTWAELAKKVYSIIIKNKTK